MLSRPAALLRRMARSLGVRVVAMAILALLSVLLAPVIDLLIPESLKDRFSADAVLPILTLLASSMLAVTTFSLAVMVNASQAAASQATPRAYRIVMADGVTQTVLATFVSAFLFSLTGVVVFRAGFYEGATSVVMFGLTIVMIAMITVAILRWIDHLSRLGSMDHTLRMVEDAARDALKTMAQAPSLGARVLGGEAKGDGHDTPVIAPRSGYLQLIDMNSVESALEDGGASLRFAVRPGDNLLEGTAIGWLDRNDGQLAETIAKALTIEDERTLEQDPRFGLLILAEIAQRALSPGINDPGTAIDVGRRLTRLLWETGKPSGDEPTCKHVAVPALDAGDLLEDAFVAMSRDAAERPEVIGVIRDGLKRLESSDWDDLAEAARKLEI